MKILVTAGPTREFIDPVRFLSNPSTGKMGIAIAEAAQEKGHEVVLICGPTSETIPGPIRSVAVVNAKEMRDQVMNWFDWCDGVVMTAAVADYTPELKSEQKIKKGNGGKWSLKLIPTADILAELGSQKGNKWLVGFAAETENLKHNAAEKLKKKNLDMILVNDIQKSGSGFGSDTNEVSVIRKSGSVEILPQMTKSDLGNWLIDEIEKGIA